VLYPRPVIGGPSDTTMVDTLDGTPGLERQSLSDQYALWRLSDPGGALRVLAEDGIGAEALTLEGEAADLTGEVASGGPGRLLSLAEPAGSGWRATLDGAELPTAATEYGNQAWELPVEGGRVRVWHTDYVHTAWLVTQAVLVVVVAVLAAPGVRTEEDVRLIESTPRPRPRRPEGLRRSRRRSRSGRTRSGGADRSERSERPRAAGPEPESPEEEPSDGNASTGALPVTRAGGRRRGTRGTRRRGRRRDGRGRSGGDTDTTVDEGEE
jgi:hypothetical protein